VVWEATPQRDRSGRDADLPIKEMWLGLGRKIRPDHLYRIEVEYDNPLEVPAPSGGMGQIGGIILVERSIAWPKLEPTNPVYVEDLAAVLATERPADDELAP
jgi:hypothetical protein